MNKLTLILLSCFLSLTSAFANDTLYTVHDVNVDVTADSAVTAQEHAMEQAKIKAFKMLLTRILSVTDIDQIGEIDSQKIDDLILDYEVTQQKNSAVRYMATLTFSFDESAVKRFLKQKPVIIDDAPNSPIVVIPIFMRGDKPSLWGENNPWLNAWANRNQLGVVTPIVVPMGDLQDINDLSAEQAIATDATRLQAIARRYGAGGSLVIVAHAPDPEDGADLEVDLTLVDLEGQIRTPRIDAIPITDTSLNKEFDQAINLAVNAIDNLAKQHHGIEAQNQDFEAQTMSSALTLRATIQFADLDDWLRIQNSLKDINTIQAVRIKKISRSNVEVMLIYSGSEQTLASALGARGLILTRTDGSSWLISTKTLQPSQL